MARDFEQAPDFRPEAPKKRSDAYTVVDQAKGFGVAAENLEPVLNSDGLEGQRAVDGEVKPAAGLTKSFWKSKGVGV